MEPPNKGHVWTRSFVLYREVSFILRLKCTGIIGIGTSRFVLYREVLFIRSVLYRRFHCISFSSGTLWPDKLPLQMECQGGGPHSWLTAQRVTQRHWCLGLSCIVEGRRATRPLAQSSPFCSTCQICTQNNTLSLIAAFTTVYHPTPH